jgi:hypothetical protein
MYGEFIFRQHCETRPPINGAFVCRIPLPPQSYAVSDETFTHAEAEEWCKNTHGTHLLRIYNEEMQAVANASIGVDEGWIGFDPIQFHSHSIDNGSGSAYAPWNATMRYHPWAKTKD